MVAVKLAGLPALVEYTCPEAHPFHSIRRAFRTAAFGAALVGLVSVQPRLAMCSPGRRGKGLGVSGGKNSA